MSRSFEEPQVSVFGDLFRCLLLAVEFRFFLLAMCLAGVEEVSPEVSFFFEHSWQFIPQYSHCSSLKQDTK